MKRHWIYRIMVGLILIPPLISCGDGDKNLAGGGIGGTGISVGTITGFGSVFVNGIEFNTEDAVITVDGNVASESALGIGMVVTVEGTFDKNGLTGTAESITYEELVEGPVDDIDLDEEILIVLGRTILISNGTVFVGVSLETLTPGFIVEVSGVMNSSGEVEATRIELKSGITEFEITGIVENLEANTFTIEDVMIDFTNADLDALPGGMLSNGLRVEVESTAGIVDGVLIASRIEPQESALENAEGLRVEIEGIVTKLTSTRDFEVNGIPVLVNDDTDYEHGFESDIALDAKLEVEGSIVNSILVADEIEFRVENAVDIEANVQAVDTDTGTLVFFEDIITVNVNNLTVFRDVSNDPVRTFGLNNIVNGDELEVSAILLEDGTIIATRVLRLNPVSKVALEGPVTDILDPTFEILGVSVMTSGETEFLDSNEMPIISADFFSTVDIGSIVEAEGTLTEENVIIADEVEFED